MLKKISNNGYDSIKLNYSIRAGIVPLRINNKTIAAKILPLYKITQNLFNHLDRFSQIALLEYSKGNNKIGWTIDSTPADFLKTNKSIHHGFFITYNKSLILLGLNELIYKIEIDNYFHGINISYVEKFPLIYPGNKIIKYLGNYPEDKNSYEVKGISMASLAQAAAYVLDLIPKENYPNYYKNGIIGLDFKTTNQNLLKIAKKYGYQASSDGTIKFTFKQIEEIYNLLDLDFKQQNFPEGLGLCYRNPVIRNS